MRHIREVEAALGSGVKAAQPCEAAAFEWALKHLVAARDLPSGAVLKEDMLLAKKCLTGLSPRHLPELLGRRLSRSLEADQPWPGIISPHEP